MKFQGALVKEQGATFGIVVVKPHVLNSSSEADSMRKFGVRAFGPVPIILMAQNSRGVPTYLGRQDIVKFLAKVPIHAIPWREYTLN
jgi:hypothetical protein